MESTFWTRFVRIVSLMFALWTFERAATIIWFTQFAKLIIRISSLRSATSTWIVFMRIMSTIRTRPVFCGYVLSIALWAIPRVALDFVVHQLFLRKEPTLLVRALNVVHASDVRTWMIASGTNSLRKHPPNNFSKLFQGGLHYSNYSKTASDRAVLHCTSCFLPRTSAVCRPASSS